MKPVIAKSVQFSCFIGLAHEQRRTAAALFDHASRSGVDPASAVGNALPLTMTGYRPKNAHYAPARFLPRTDSPVRCAATCVCLVLILEISLSAQAGDVYKWTDENGNTHYSDRPGEPGSQEIVLPAEQGAPDAEAAARRERARHLLEVIQEERQEERSLEQERQAKLKERKANCQRARDAQRSYGDAGRIFEYDESGEKRYLSDEELVAYRAKLSEQVDYWCR